MKLRLNFFGSLTAEIGEITIDLEKLLGKQLSGLFALLAYNHGKVVSKEKLFAALWQDSDNPAWSIASGTGVDTKMTCTLPITLDWATPYEGGFLKWVNTNHENGTGAWEAMEAFKNAIDATTITCTVKVQVASGAGA